MKRILHFGPGNFFRAHLAEYTHDAGGWSITGVSLRSAKVRDGLARQGNEYTLSIQSQGTKRITVIDKILLAADDPSAVLKEVADPSVHIISATVTEKGYYIKGDGSLDLDHPDIRRDLESKSPSTLLGYLAHGLAMRTAPVTVLSCDNRNGNGDALAKVVAEFAQSAGLTLKCVVTFPNSMVDRITPATSDEVREQTGDPMAVPCEPFKEWVVEDRFAGPRPDWPGVNIVSDVAPHEMRKLRMLNGTHSLLAYSGVVAGHVYVHEAIADRHIAKLASRYMDEAAQTLTEDVRIQSVSYSKELLARWNIPHVRHRLRQIAMDGTEKLPYRTIEPLRERVSNGLASPGMVFGLNAWISFCQQEVLLGRAIEDPRSSSLEAAAKSEDPRNALLDVLGASDLASVLNEE